MADMGPSLRRDDMKKRNLHDLIGNFRIRGPGSSLPALIEGGFLKPDDDRVAATAAGRQRLNAGLAAVLS